MYSSKCVMFALSICLCCHFLSFAACVEPVKLPPTLPPTTRTNQVAKKSVVACPRTQSKLVREYFVRVLLPIYQKYGVPVPEKCPFSPLYDIYHYHENNKTKVDSTKWRCEICGKTFTDEKFLDKHFDSRHNNSLQRVDIACL
jgi:hypothetical protein